MLFYLFLIVFIMLLSILVKDKKKYCILCGVFLLLIMGFRNPTLGNSDTVSLYIPSFYRVFNLDFASIFRVFGYSDVLFYEVTKLFTLVSNNLNLYFGLCAVPFCFFSSRLIYKYSKLPVLSFIMLFCLNFYSWSFIVIRHAVALGFIIWSYDYLKQKKFIPFCLTVLLAACFHKTSIVFLLAYPASYLLKINSYKVYVYPIAFVFIVTLFGDMIMDLLFSIIKTGHFSSYRYRDSVMGPGMFIIYYFVFLFASFVSKNVSDEEQIDYNIVYVGVLFSILSLIFAEFFRIGMFFNIFGIVLLPNSISKIKDKRTRIVVIVLLMILCGIYGILSFDNLGLIPYSSNIFN